MTTQCAMRLSFPQQFCVELNLNHKLSFDFTFSVFEDMEAEGYDYDHDELGQQKEPLTLRNYQQELARPALEGKNCIIVAPAGSGKTHVALKIMQVR